MESNQEYIGRGSYLTHKPGVGLMTALGRPPEEERYKELVFSFKKMAYALRNTKRQRVLLPLEREAAYLMREVQSYGFEFVPEVYVAPLLNRLDVVYQAMVKIQQEDARG